MNKQDIFDGFSIELFLDEERDWIAHFEEFANVSACGSTPEEALHELQTAWEAMKESYVKNDEPVPVAPSRKIFSGMFNVRIDRRIHRALAIEAAQAGISLNSLVNQKLSNTS
jgi:predicted HicB family RNase H-like nuclease